MEFFFYVLSCITTIHRLLRRTLVRPGILFSFLNNQPNPNYRATSQPYLFLLP